MDEKMPPAPTGSVLVDAAPPAPATAFGKVAQCSRCHATPLSAQEIQGGWLCQTCSDGAAEQMEQQRLGGSLAATPCQVMFGWAPGSPSERPCGATPTVGGNGLYRYCERHMRMAAKAGATTLERDADADLQIDDNGDLVATTLASCKRAEKFARAMRERIETVSTEVATSIAELESLLGGPPIGKVNGIDDAGMILLPPGAVTQHVAILLGTQHVGGACCQDNERCPRCGGINHSQPLLSKHSPPEVIDTDDACERCTPERWYEPGVPIAKAPPPEALPELRAKSREIRGGEHGRMVIVDTDAPPLRPDGFSQTQVDAAKAVLLAPAAKRGGR